MGTADDMRARLAGVADPLGLLQGLFEHSPVPYAVFDRDGHCLLVNPAYRAMFGQAPPPEYSLLKDEVAARLGLSALFRNAYAGETVRTPTFWYDPRQLAHADGSRAKRVAISCTLFPLYDGTGAVDQVAIAYKDVTAELLAQAQAEGERDLLRAILEQSGDGIIVADEGGTLRVFNPEAQRQHGSSGQAVGAAEWARTYGLLRLDGAPLPLEETPLYRAVRGERVEGARWLVCRADGERRLLTGTASPLRRPDGTSAGAVLTTRDETERTRADEALRRSEERYRSLIEATTSIIWTCSDTGAFEVDQPSWTRFTGQPFAALRGWGWLDAVHPEDRARTRAAWDEAVAGAAGRYETTYRLRRHDGVWRFVEVRATRVLEPDGRTREWVGIDVDVTDKREAEARLAEVTRASVERHRFLADAGAALGSSLDYDEMLTAVGRLVVPYLADWCFVEAVEEDGTFRRVSVAHADPADAALAAEARRFSLHARPETSRAMREGLPGGAPIFWPDLDDDDLPRLATSEAHLRTMRAIGPRSVISVPLRARGRTVGALTLAATRSGRRYTAADLETAQELAARTALAAENARLFRAAQEAAARAEAANRAKDEFLAMLGHELRNPLAPIATALDVIRMKGDGPAAREREIIGRQVEHLRRLVDDLLDVSRITSGKIELRKEVLPVAELVHKALELAGPLLEARRHRLVVRLPDEPLACAVDPVRMTQVVVNLLTNAAKYTPPGGVVEVVARAAGGELEIVVRDTGIGIAPALVDRVFDLFVQGPQGLARAEGGLGLGLAIVRTLVTQHGGRVSAASAGPGQGSTFTVTLPLAAPVGARAAVDPAASAPRPVAPAGRRVLVVDDNEDAAELLAELLASYGHEVRVAHDGPSALTLARAFRPEVALVDIGLPVMDGYELGARLRAEPALAGLRLVALTGYGQASDRARTREVGFDEHLVKPADPEAIGRAIAG